MKNLSANLVTTRTIDESVDPFINSINDCPFNFDLSQIEEVPNELEKHISAWYDMKGQSTFAPDIIPRLAQQLKEGSSTSTTSSSSSLSLPELSSTLKHSIHPTTNTASLQLDALDAYDLEINETDATLTIAEQQRRFAHMTSEQKRRHNLNLAFIELRNSLPNCKDKHNMSKAAILRGATDYLCYLSTFRDEAKNYRKENEELRNSLKKRLTRHQYQNLLKGRIEQEHTKPKIYSSSSNCKYRGSNMNVYFD